MSDDKPSQRLDVWHDAYGYDSLFLHAQHAYLSTPIHACQPWQECPPLLHEDAWFNDANGHWVEEVEIEVEIIGPPNELARVKRRIYKGEQP